MERTGGLEMTELKTLKDIPSRIKINTNGFKDVDDLKSEAVKWVKWLDTQRYEVKHNRQAGKVHNICIEREKAILMRFHNITAEDLKDSVCETK